MAQNLHIGATAPSREDIVKAIVDQLQSVLGTELGVVAEDAKLFDELGLDSTGVLDLILRLEDSLHVEFDTDNLQFGNFESVGTLADFVLAEAAG